MPLKDNALPDYIGPYKVEKQIAVGGMGEIYLVYEAACARKVALKKNSERQAEISHATRALFTGS